MVTHSYILGKYVNFDYIWYQDESDCNPATFRLYSEQAKQLTSDAHGKTNGAWAEGAWKTRWDTIHCRLLEFIHTPSSKPIGHDLTRHSLVRLNRIRTGYGRFKYNMSLMGLSPSASRECGAASQTTHHIAVRTWSH